MAQKVLFFILISILLISCSKKQELIQNPERKADIQRMLTVQKELTSKSLIPIWDILTSRFLRMKNRPWNFCMPTCH